MISAMIFDWSGVLNDNFHCFKEVCDAVFSHFSRPLISEEEIRETFTTPYMKFWNRYLPEYTLEEQNRMYKELILQTSPSRMYPGVRETLLKLKNFGIQLFVVSGDPYEQMLPEVER